MKEETKKEITKKDIEKVIEELTKKGKANAEIGLYIKQEYNIKNIYAFCGEKIIDIQRRLKLKENKLPDDLLALINRAVKLIKHKDKNKKDTRAIRGYQITVSKINRLRNYYIKKGRIPKNWRYSDENAKLITK
jgi:small subunit ribosomal protein S15